MYNETGVFAVIAAGGSGTRFGTGEVPKQFAELDGSPIIARTIDIFEKNSFIDGIVVVSRKDCVDLCDEIIRRHGFAKVIETVCGGDDRQSSVFAGLSRLYDIRGDCAVLIHDGARPLTEKETVNGVIEAVSLHGAAVPGLRITDAVKRAGADGFIETEVCRDGLFTVQTPQGFWLKDILSAHRTAAANGFKAPDDAALAARIGIPVAITVGSASNIKITGPGDMFSAKKIIAGRIASGTT